MLAPCGSTPALKAWTSNLGLATLYDAQILRLAQNRIDGTWSLAIVNQASIRRWPQPASMTTAIAGICVLTAAATCLPSTCAIRSQSMVHTVRISPAVDRSGPRWSWTGSTHHTSQTGIGQTADGPSVSLFQACPNCCLTGDGGSFQCPNTVQEPG